MNRRHFLAAAGAFAGHGGSVGAPAEKLNVVQILIDDMGYADLGCYGAPIQTPNIDRIARQGIRFTQGYVAAPVCSPSRVGITTGQFPSRNRFYSYLDTRQHDREVGMPDYLDRDAPSVARAFQKAGYATGHFGKWHMGGGRDVGDAPLPTEYGFDRSLTSFEGLGDRVLPPGRLSELNEKLGRGKISHAAQNELTGIYVDAALSFVKDARQAGKPFYIHLWPNDVHDPFAPKPELLKKYERFSSNKYVQQYYASIDEMDRQIGRFIDALQRLGAAGNTLVVLLSDNGPTAWPRYYKEGLEPPGSTAGLRGRKWSLYEGGIRIPFMASLPGRIPEGRVDRTTVLSSIDLFPTCCRLANIALPKVPLDGQDMSSVLLGRPAPKRKDLFWEYGRSAGYVLPGLESDRSPSFGMRSGRWKFLMNADGSRKELYDFAVSDREVDDVSGQHPAEAQRLEHQLRNWMQSLPGPPAA